MGREGKAKDGRLLKMRIERRSDRVEDTFGPFLAPDPDSQLVATLAGRANVPDGMFYALT